MLFLTKNEENVLFMCAQKNQLKALIYLLQRESTSGLLGSQNIIGDNILHKAARYGFTNMVSYLLTIEGLDRNQQNTEGWTPLMEAANNKHKEIGERKELKRGGGG